MAEQQQSQQITIQVPEALRGGSYANTMLVAHTKEEFIMDFMMIVPREQQPEATLVSRVLIHPAHMKRVIFALQDNLHKYEEKFGQVEPAVEPNRRPLGFST